MIKTIAICVLVMGVMLQGCDKGCLKCSSSNQCQFCDVTNNYYLNNTACVTSSLTNCLLLGNSGACLQCGPNYYLDSNTQKCVAVGSSSLLSNCASYGSNQGCSSCAKNFYINVGNCTAVTKLVDNCDTYSADGVCAICSSGYIFNAARNGCVANPNTSSCSAYSFISCKSCSTGYISNQNYYLAFLQNSTSVLQSTLLTYVAGGKNDWSNMPTCQQYLDANCLTASAYNVCTACKAGYFLNSQYGCTAYPLPIILGCKTYSSLTTCSNCNIGYVLSNTTSCTLITTAQLITNCVTYNNAVSAVTCTQCATSQFLSSNNCNSTRTASLTISNCNATTVSADTCESCSSGYRLTTDKLACLPLITNCATYSTSSKTDSNFTCTSCNDGNYLNGSGNTATCVQGTIAGCLVYSSSTACSSCDNKGYWINGSTCTAHVVVDKCSTYSTANYNQCSSCSVGYFPFKYSTTCQSVTVINNCITYNADGTCSACATGYFLKSNACLAYTSVTSNCNAVNAAGTTCTGCIDKFALLANSTCSSIHDYIKDNCDTLNSAATFKDISTADTNTCKTCASGTYPFKYDNLFACVHKDLLATKVATAVTNCAQWSNDATPLCLQCVTGSYLTIPASGARTCGTCDTTTMTNIFDALDGNINTCQTQGATTYALASCSIAIEVYTGGAVAKKCIKFAANYAYVNSLMPTDNPTFYKDIGVSTVPVTTGAFLFNGYEVTNFATTLKHTPDATYPCELYYTASSGNYACLRCKFGSSATLASSMTTCAVITDCNTGITYGGFSSAINQLLSCHACNNSKVPVIHVAMDGPAIASDNISGLFAAQQSVVCQATNTATHTAVSPKAIDNCLIYATGYDSANSDAIVAGCAACKPGYKPSATTPFFATCAAIDMCDSTKTAMANRCGGCKQTNATNGAEYKAFVDVTLQACYKSKSANCLILAASPTPSDATVSYECATCMPGYNLNTEKQCEKITLPRCNDASSTLYAIPTWDATLLTTYYMLKSISGSSSISGCTSCQTNYVGIKMPANEQQCVNSTYVVANTFTTTGYITDCDKYSNALATVTCTACKSGKILTADNLKCVTAPSNCAVADSTTNTNCVQCAGNYAAISGTCTLKNIVNCKTYSENISSMQCATCDDGYVRSTDKTTCYLGNQPGCLTYDDDKPNKCTTCDTGYQLVTLNPADTAYCFQINSGSNCSALDASSSTGLAGGVYTCTACSSSNSAAYAPKTYQTSNTTIVQSLCLALNPITNCIGYDQAHAIAADNAFNCTSCSANFYLNSTKNKCTARTNQPSACQTYYNSADKCTVCDTTSTFKKVDETDCVSFPNGIYQCATYSNTTVCTSCNSPYYLTNNTCSLSTVINNCVAYSANYTCTACASGYFLNNSTSCVTANATNCYTFANISACASCDPTNINLGLKTETSGVVNCVLKNVANCAISTNQYPFACTRCNAGFYLNSTSGACVAVTTTITGCLIYDSATTCTLCQQTYVLSVNRTTCSNTAFASDVDAQCVDSQQLSTAACSECNPGSIFVNGTCSACTNSTYANGCFSCDPNNQATCISCRPGYYMTQSGSCVAVSGINSNPSSATIAQLFGLLALLFALLF